VVGQYLSIVVVVRRIEVSLRKGHQK